MGGILVILIGFFLFVALVIFSAVVILAATVKGADELVHQGDHTVRKA